VKDQPLGQISSGNSCVLSAVGKTNPFPKALLSSVERIGGRLVEAGHPSFSDALEWVIGQFERSGYSITRDAAESMVMISGRNMDNLEKEIEKVKLFLGPATKVTASLVLSCVAPDPEANTFALLDAVATKNLSKASSELQELMDRGVNPVLIVAALASHFSLLWRAKAEASKGVTPNSLARLLGVHPYSAKKALEQSKRWTFGELEYAIRLLCHLDERLKRGSIDPQTGMNHLIVSLSVSGSHD